MQVAYVTKVNIGYWPLGREPVPVESAAMTTLREPKHRTARGCGCAALVGAALAVIVLVAVVAWVLSLTQAPSSGHSQDPVPATLPPAGAPDPPQIDTDAPGRTSNELAEWAEPIAADTKIPPQALRAYGNATLIAKQSWPNCHLHWNTLAGLGWVETRHGTYSGRFDSSQLNADGYPVPEIIGPALDGTGGFLLVHDTDDGALDHDSHFDRAVGPMQFIPESWRIYGRDADGDGEANPQQIDDAALGAANLLCAFDRDLDSEADWREAIASYNHSGEYLAKVRDAAANYAVNQPAHR